MLATIETRFIHNKDFERIVKIDKSSDYSYEPENLHKFIQNEGTGIVATDARDFPLGFCIYKQTKGKNYWDIVHLVVDTKFRRKGIGEVLINRMKNKINEKRPILRFDVAETCLDVQLFLKAMGFKAVLIRKDREDILRFKFEG